MMDLETDNLGSQISWSHCVSASVKPNVKRTPLLSASSNIYKGFVPVAIEHHPNQHSILSAHPMDHLSTISSPTGTMPDPGSFFRLLMHVLNSRILGRSITRPKPMKSLEEYDIDYATGFFPPQPLKPLEGAFELWERALEEAKRVLSLGSDVAEEAVAKQANGEGWRERIRSVSRHTAA